MQGQGLRLDKEATLTNGWRHVWKTDCRPNRYFPGASIRHFPPRSNARSLYFRLRNIRENEIMNEAKRSEAPHYELEAEPGYFNVSPHGFRRWAKDFYQCRQAFQPNHFSPVPYFLLCRAIELWFKAIHLDQQEISDVKAVKKDYGHSQIKLYEALPASIMCLRLNSSRCSIKQMKSIRQKPRASNTSAWVMHCAVFLTSPT
jgi:hypothetical protein